MDPDKVCRVDPRLPIARDCDALHPCPEGRAAVKQVAERTLNVPVVDPFTNVDHTAQQADDYPAYSPTRKWQLSFLPLQSAIYIPAN